MMMERHSNVTSIVAGCLLGLASVFLKDFLATSAAVPLAASVLLGLLGGFILQYSLAYEKMHRVASLSSGASSLLSALGGMLLLGEALSAAELAGIGLIVAGILFLAMQRSRTRA